MNRASMEKYIYLLHFLNKYKIFIVADCLGGAMHQKNLIIFLPATSHFVVLACNY